MWQLNVYAPSSRCGFWINQQLFKDCGLVPYMLHKLYGYNAVMVGPKYGEYPYLSQLPGLQMDFLPDCPDEDSLLRHHLEYLAKNYAKIDVLILRGVTSVNQRLLSAWRKLRPDGKAYVGLDANSAWMDRIYWTVPEFTEMLDGCDVIATSCRKMQRHLSRKWPNWKINYIPNGFYSPKGYPPSPEAGQKENIILTVGRIGAEQKANHILLEAFACVSGALPGWSLRLAGGVAPAFLPAIDAYFAKYPHLRARVTFTGLIEDKQALYAEYRRAKIFALTSIFEGGNPNVVAEALFHGCYMVTSDVDGAEDITAGGRVGRVFPIDDTAALSAIFLEICQNETMLQEKVPEILNYAKNTFDWECIIKRLHHLLFLR